MPPKKLSITKTSLGKLTKPVLLDLALSVGLVLTKKPILKANLISFILANVNDECMEKFKELLRPTDNDSVIPSILQDSLEQEILEKAKQCTTLNELLTLLTTHPQFLKNREIKKLLKKLPDSDESDCEPSVDPSVVQPSVTSEPSVVQPSVSSPSVQSSKPSIVQPSVQPSLSHPVQTSMLPPQPKSFLKKDSSIFSIDDEIEKLSLNSPQPSTSFQASSLRPSSSSKPSSQSSIMKPSFETTDEQRFTEKIKNANGIVEILAQVKNSSEIKLSVLSDVDFDMARAFGF